MVRPPRLTGLLPLVAAVLLGGSSRGALPQRSAAEHGARVVAWVDFDVEPARRGVARFAELLQTQRFDDPRPVTVQFVGTDVADPKALASELDRLVATRPALVVASSVTVAHRLLELHTGIPVYFVLQSDPMRDGLVPSLLSTGSMTGYTFFVPLDVKVMELIRRLFPTCRTVGILADPVWLSGSIKSRDLEPQAQSLGLDLQIYELRALGDVERTLKSTLARKVQLWYVPYTEMAFDHGGELATELAQTRKPTIYARRKFLKLGGLLSVQAIDVDAMHIWAASIANILNGASPGSIPVTRPKEIEIAVNSTALARFDQSTRERIARDATVFE